MLRQPKVLTYLAGRGVWLMAAPLGCRRHPVLCEPGLGAAGIDGIHPFYSVTNRAVQRKRSGPELDGGNGGCALRVVGVGQRQPLAADRRGHADRHVVHARGRYCRDDLLLH